MILISGVTRVFLTKVFCLDMNWSVRSLLLMLMISDGYYVAYKLITLPCISFILIDI